MQPPSRLDDGLEGGREDHPRSPQSNRDHSRFDRPDTDRLRSLVTTPTDDRDPGREIQALRHT